MMTSTPTKTPEEIAALMARAHALAEQITKQSWLDEGYTEEQWERWPIEVDVYAMMMHRGASEAEALAFIDTASWEEIQRKHREMYPGRYVAK